MRIRAARVDEAESLAALAFAAKASWGYPSALLETWRADLEPSPSSIADRPTFVAEVDGAPAGFAQLDLDAEPVELEHLWVHPRAMRRGIGRALLAHCARHLAALGVDTLHIDSDPHAEAFYVACGAERVAVRPAPIAGAPDRIRPQLRIATRAAVSAAGGDDPS